MDVYRPGIGTPIEALDTPCLLIDLDALEHNQRVIADTYRDTVCKMAPHVKNTKCPVIIHMQFRAGGTAESVCSAKVSEAEVMVESGIHSIFIANQVTAADKIERLCSLAKRAAMRVAIDDTRNVRALSQAAVRHGVTIGVIIEVSVRDSGGRAGVRMMAPGGIEQGVELAKLARDLPGIEFKGVMSHQTLPGKPDRETRFLDGPPLIQRCLDVKDAIEAAGIPVEVVSSGETFSYDISPTMPGVTEVEGGTYMFMSHPFDYMTDFEIAAKVLGTVISTPRPGTAIGDVGSRALASTSALPAIDGIPGVAVDELHEEHIILKVESPARLGIGDQFLLTSGQQDFMTDRWDQHIAVRNGVVEAVWPILARGCYHWAASINSGTYSNSEGNMTTQTKEDKAQLQYLMDEQAIIRALHEYAHSFDYGPEERFRDCFTETCTTEKRWRGEFESRNLSQRRDSSRPWTPTKNAKHVVSVPMVKSIEGDTASTEAYWTYFVEGGDNPHLQSFGRYIDKFKKGSDGRWRIHERIIDVEARTLARQAKIGQ